MIDTPSVARLPDGRLHLRHGPIELIIRAEGAPDECDNVYAAAVSEFPSILPALAGELEVLRTEISAAGPVPRSVVGERMVRACEPYHAHRVTPMAAVAGAVADHILETMCVAGSVRRAWVNNGGDIAVFLATGESFHCGLIPELTRRRIEGSIRLDSNTACRGIATSGRATRGHGGRSFSLGIADAVTVVAADAAAADVAATLIANHVDLPGHGGIRRVAACDIDPDSDLRNRRVVTDVAPLDPPEVDAAIARGAAMAERWVREMDIDSVAICLQGRKRLVGAAPLLQVA